MIGKNVVLKNYNSGVVVDKVLSNGTTRYLVERNGDVIDVGFTEIELLVDSYKEHDSYLHNKDMLKVLNMDYDECCDLKEQEEIEKRIKHFL